MFCKRYISRLIHPEHLFAAIYCNPVSILSLWVTMLLYFTCCYLFDIKCITATFPKMHYINPNSFFAMLTGEVDNAVKFY